MKHFINFLLFFAIIFLFSACLKGVGDPAPSTLVGNWAIANDSTITGFWGLWSGRPDTGINYIGQPGDHFNFMSNGKVYIKEGAELDTGTYTLSKDNQLEIKFNYLNGQPNQGGWTKDYVLSQLTNHAAKLTGGTFVSPETSYTHIINLQK